MLPANAPCCDPNAPGPLTDDPTVSTGMARIFESEDRYLSKRKLKERELIWQAVEE